MSRRTMSRADALSPGDKFFHGGAVLVTVLREAEDAKDIFGRKMMQFWCRRNDTGAEGYVQFGRSGKVELAKVGV